MANDNQSREAFAGVTAEELAAVLYRLDDHICVHRPIFDEFDAVVDGELVWWNESYRDVHRYDVQAGQKISEKYIDPHIALAHIATAWETGRSLQILELNPRLLAVLRYQGDEEGVWIHWLRISDLVIEVSSKVSEVLALRRLIGDQKSLLAIASRKRAMAVERERIARNLHDNVIQNLYATSLALSSVSRKAHGEVVRAINLAVDALADVIAEIRREILDIENQRASSLRLELEDVLIPILTPSGAQLELFINAAELDDKTIQHVRSVCIEGASNAVRHGQASNISVSVETTDDELILAVVDDGIGIDVNSIRHNGLHNMRERAETLGGNMEIQANINKGTTLTWSVPFIGRKS